MNDDSKKVVRFPTTEIAPEEQAVEVPKADVSPEAEERARRVTVEVERLASMPEVEWRFYLATDGVAEKYGLSRADMEKMIKARIQEREKKAKYDKAEDRRSEKDKVTAQREREREQAKAANEAKRKQREKDRALAAILKLPKSVREFKLGELARTLGEDVELLREELALLAGDEEEKLASGVVEPWPEPVDTRELLSELETQFRHYIVVHREHVAVATVLWICFAWCHEIATYSPLLVIEAGAESAGKTNASSVVARLSPNAQLAAELRGPTLFRLVDRDHPTLVIDDAEQLLPRRPDLAQIIKVSWTRGVTIPRVDAHGNVRRFDPFCPKVLNGINLTAQLDKATQTRCITVKLLPKLRDEEVAKFRHAIRDERFLMLQRKAKRWATDNMPALMNADPAMPAALDDRYQMNWELLFAIADLAGPEWAQRARAAAIKLSPREESSQSKRLLAAFRDLFRQHGPLLTSQQIERLLATYGDGEWASYKNGRPINKWEVAILLKPYDIAPGTIHPRGRPADRGYDERQFETAFRHFLPPENPPRDRTVVRKSRGKRQK